MITSKGMNTKLEFNMNNGKYTKLVMFAIIIILIITNWTSCQNKKDIEQKNKQNEEAIKNKIVIERNENGDLQNSIAAYESNIKELKNYNIDLYNEVKALKNRKAKVIINTRLVYAIDTQFVYSNTIDTIGLDKDEYRLSWVYRNLDSSRILEGNSVFKALFQNSKLNITPKYTELIKDELFIDLVVGVAKNKKTGFDEIFVTPKNPDIKIKSLQGAILEKKKLGIDLSISAGYGLNYSGKGFGFGPLIGLSISKPLIKF